MQQFIQRHADQVNGVLSGFDRVRLRGTLRWLASVRGMMSYLSVVSLKLVEFKEYAQDCTATIRAATAELARSTTCVAVRRGKRRSRARSPRATGSKAG